METGADLHQACGADSAAQDQLICLSYLKGFIQGISIIEIVANKRFLCLPESGGTLGQDKAVVQKYLDDHPDEWHKPSSLLVYFALAKAFPCP